MSVDQLKAFLVSFSMTGNDLAHVLGVTEQAVAHWLKGRRDVPPTAVKLIHYFQRKPQEIREFQ